LTPPRSTIDSQVGVKEILNITGKIKDIAADKPPKQPKPPTPDEVKVFREVTGRYPNKINYDDIVKAVSDVAKRLLRPVTAADLQPFYAAWTARGYNPLNIAWLAWAGRGDIPDPKVKQVNQQPKAFDAIAQWQAMKGK